ncbi:MAG: hypothetical protein EP330_30200 [Deltaproteobacteria bacterium]|nr:MAG: hypothetical protein EP330_30200 [Deltaproteobacteria bacterium]
MNRLLAVLGTGVVAAVGAHAIAFTLTGALWAVTGWRAAQYLATPFAILAFAAVNLGLVAAVLTPKVPMRVVLPLWVAQAYVGLGAMPFGLLMLIHRGYILVPGLLLCVAVALSALLVRRLPHSQGFAIDEAFVAERAGFSPLRTAGLLLALGVAIPSGVAGYLAGSAAWSVSYATGGYAGITTEGFVVRARTFTRPDTTVTLQGMMHIGEARAYEDLYASFGAQPNTVVLTEGVTDDEDRLGRGGVGYARMAGRLGLEQQHEIEGDGFVVRNADVDVAQFSEETLEMLRMSFAIWGSDDPVAAWLSYSAKYATADPETLYRPLYEDVLLARNDALLAAIEAAEPEFAHIIAPWGAAHLPGVGASLEERGYVPGEWSERLLWSWGTVFRR